MELKPLEAFEFAGKTENRARLFFKKLCAKNGHKFFEVEISARKTTQQTGLSYPMYLKEMEFRYNNRHRNIFNLLIENLCSQVPESL